MGCVLPARANTLEPREIVKWNSIVKVHRNLCGWARTFGALQKQNVKCQRRGTTHLLWPHRMLHWPYKSAYFGRCCRCSNHSLCATFCGVDRCLRKLECFRSGFIHFPDMFMIACFKFWRDVRMSVQLRTFVWRRCVRLVNRCFHLCFSSVRAPRIQIFLRRCFGWCFRLVLPMVFKYLK